MLEEATIQPHCDSLFLNIALFQWPPRYLIWPLLSKISEYPDLLILIFPVPRILPGT